MSMYLGQKSRNILKDVAIQKTDGKGIGLDRG